MKIMFYITTIERGGGAERVICNLANQFSNAGNQCIVVTSNDSEQKYELGKNIEYIPLTDTRISSFIRRNWKLFRLLRKVVAEHKPDVLISFMAEPNFRTIPACAGTKTKTIISVRNDPNREYPSLIHKFLAKTLFRKADFTVFQTKDAQTWFPKSIIRKSAIIKNQVDYRFFDEKQIEIPSNILSVGRLEPQKNHKLLIDAFSKISDKCSDNLIIIGEGSLRAELENQIVNLGLSKRVLLPGTTDNVMKKLKSAKIFALSSDYEGLPNTLMEAMAIGLPCVSTDCPCGGPKELILNENNGLLTQVGNVDSMSAALARFLSDDALRKKCGDNAKRTAMAFYPDSIFALWDKTIKSVIEN